MEKLFNNTKKIIFTKQKDIYSSALIISLMIILSRFFGLIRYRIYNTYFTKEELGIFFAAFRVPDFIFELLITGALSSAFIPIFIKYKQEPKHFNRYISSIINFIIITLFFFSIILFTFADIIIPLITPGFSSQDTTTIISISRLLIILQLPFLVLGNILTGIAQANNIFLISALAPILYNVGIITGTILFAKDMWIYGTTIGVGIGAFLFFIIQVPIPYLTKFIYIPYSLNKKVLKEFIFLFIPRVMAVMTTQIDLFIDLVLASFLGPASYTIFIYAQQLQLFPVSFIGLAFGQASLPYLSNLYKLKQLNQIKKIFVSSILQLLYFSTPLSIFFIFARTPIVRIIFGARKFDWIGTNHTAMTLSLFAIAIPAHTIFYFITRAFYANHDTKTPFIINFFSVFINIALSSIFIILYKLPIWFLALSFSISVTINVFILLVFFYRKIGGFNYKKLIKNSSKIYAASTISAIFPYLALKIMDPLIINTTLTINLLFLLSFVFSFFCILYIFFSWLFTIEEIYMISKILLKMKDMKRKITEFYTQM